MEIETYQASESMQKFFVKLLAVKEFAKASYEQNPSDALKTIYDQLDEIIKERAAN